MHSTQILASLFCYLHFKCPLRHLVNLTCDLSMTCPTVWKALFRLLKVMFCSSASQTDEHVMSHVTGEKFISWQELSDNLVGHILILM